MNQMLLLAGRASGVFGLLICAVAAALRLAGNYWVGSFQLSTLLLGGVAAMIGGCVLMLWALTSHLQRKA